MNYEMRTTQWTVVPEGEPLFSEDAWALEIVDDAGGEYVIVRAQGDGICGGEIAIDPKEWPALRMAIDTAISECRESENEQGTAPEDTLLTRQAEFYKKYYLDVQATADNLVNEHPDHGGIAKL